VTRLFHWATKRFNPPFLSVSIGDSDLPTTNNASTRGWGVEPLYIDRENTDTYRQSFRTAIASKADWIFITSWNEFQENTHIEPSVYYDSLYLQLTEEYIQQWKYR
jgi:hypothetical protein